MRPTPRRRTTQVVLPQSLPSETLKTSPSSEGGSRKQGHCRPLPTQFRKDGFDLVQIVRSGSYAIYETRWKGRTFGFEVIRIRRREAFRVDGREVPAAEYYPRSEEWGAHGWTLRDLEAARLKMKEVAK